MVVELLRPLPSRKTSSPDRPHFAPQRDTTRPSTSSIHPPIKRTPKRVEPTSALQFARELADMDFPGDAQIVKLAELVATQLPQGPLADRLQLYFALGKLFGNDMRISEATKAIVDIMLAEMRPLFSSIAPTLRWTTLALLASIIERPYFSKTARHLGVGYLCTLIAPAITDAAPQDKAVVYSLLSEMTRCGYVSKRNNNRILAGSAQHLRSAIREKNVKVRRQLLEQHIALLESGIAITPYAAAQVQSVIIEHASAVAESYDDLERDFFRRSLRRALV